ncbi:hypothetical protein ABVX93_000926 [Escherichia coli]
MNSVTGFFLSACCGDAKSFTFFVVEYHPVSENKVQIKNCMIFAQYQKNIPAPQAL